MRIFLLFPFLVACLTSTQVQAEYRVFKLKISKPNPDKTQPPLARTVQSTLDPIQYREIDPVDADEKVEYTETWLCRGRTDEFQDYCPNPKAQIPSSPVSNQNSP